CIAVALFWFFTVRDRPTASEVVAPEWGPLLKDRNMRWLVIGFAAVDYFEYIFFFWLYYYLGDVRKLSPADTALYTTVPFVAWVVMMPLGGWLADLLVARFGSKVGMGSIAVGSMPCSVGCLIGALSASDT